MSRAGRGEDYKLRIQLNPGLASWTGIGRKELLYNEQKKLIGVNILRRAVLETLFGCTGIGHFQCYHALHSAISGL